VRGESVVVLAVANRALGVTTPHPQSLSPWRGEGGPQRTRICIGTMALVVVIALTFTFPIHAAEHRVSNAAEIARAAGEARPGDVLVMSDGEWRDQVVVFRAKGTAAKPITLRAQMPGQVTLTGKSSVTIEGEHLVLSGLFFQNGSATGDGVKLAGRNNRLTQSAVIGGDFKFFVHLFGTSNRMDHCYLGGKTNDSPTLQIEVEGKENFHRVDHNHFGHRPPLGRNGGETIRVGYSHQSMTNSGTLVENNLFERCDGELEIISNKSCENTYRANTFLDCAGMFTLRHGNRCVVDGNFFIGHHKRGSGGIRVIGEDHLVINNYIEGVEQGGFWITSGISNSELKGYFQSLRCLIAFNTFVDSRGPAIQLDAGFGSSGRTLRPDNITIANNLFALSEGALLKGTEGGNYKWVGNITASTGVTGHAGIRIGDLKLERGQGGLWRPVSGSPARGAAEGSFALVKTDMDGQPRQRPIDIGSDQVSDAPVTRRPLMAADVGPVWNRSERGVK
jgi:poly(beta-D-mannuronate) lyase